MTVDIYGSTFNADTKEVNPVIDFEYHHCQPDLVMNISNGNAYTLLNEMGIHLSEDEGFPVVLPMEQIINGVQRAYERDDDNSAWKHYQDRFTRLVLISQAKGATHITFA